MYLHLRVGNQTSLSRLLSEQVHLHEGPLELAGLRGGGDVLHHPGGGPGPVRGPQDAQGVQSSQVRRCGAGAQGHCGRDHFLNHESEGCDHPHNLHAFNLRSHWSTGEARRR